MRFFLHRVLHRLLKRMEMKMRWLSYFSDLMIPFLVLTIVFWGIWKKKPVYENFMKGAKDGLHLMVQIMPTMIAMLLAVNVLRASGFLDVVSKFLTPLAEWIHLPAPLVPLSVVKAFSSSGATGLLLDLFKEYGVDSGIGKIGALILSSTETIFYTMSLYFVAVGITKSRYTLAGCLISSISGMIASILLAPYF